MYREWRPVEVWQQLLRHNIAAIRPAGPMRWGMRWGMRWVQTDKRKMFGGNYDAAPAHSTAGRGVQCSGGCVAVNIIISIDST